MRIYIFFILLWFSLHAGAQIVHVGSVTTTELTVTVDTVGHFDSFFIQEVRRITTNATGSYTEDAKSTLLPDSASYNNYMNELLIRVAQLNDKARFIAEEIERVQGAYDILDSLRDVLFTGRGGTGIRRMPVSPPTKPIEIKPDKKQKAIIPKNKKKKG